MMQVHYDHYHTCSSTTVSRVYQQHIQHSSASASCPTSSSTLQDGDHPTALASTTMKMRLRHANTCGADQRRHFGTTDNNNECIKNMIPPLLSHNEEEGATKRGTTTTRSNTVKSRLFQEISTGAVRRQPASLTNCISHVAHVPLVLLVGLLQVMRSFLVMPHGRGGVTDRTYRYQQLLVVFGLLISFGGTITNPMIVRAASVTSTVESTVVQKAPIRLVFPNAASSLMTNSQIVTFENICQGFFYDFTNLPVLIVSMQCQLLSQSLNTTNSASGSLAALNTVVMVIANMYNSTVNGVELTSTALKNAMDSSSGVLFQRFVTTTSDVYFFNFRQGSASTTDLPLPNSTDFNEVPSSSTSTAPVAVPTTPSASSPSSWTKPTVYVTPNPAGTTPASPSIISPTSQQPPAKAPALAPVTNSVNGTMLLHKDTVQLLMVLSKVSGLLTGTTIAFYESVTASHVKTALLSYQSNTVIMDNLIVSATIDSQVVLSSSTSTSTITNSTTSGSSRRQYRTLQQGYPYYFRRQLQQQSVELLPLRVRVKIFASYMSPIVANYEITDWVRGAFQKDTDRSTYMSMLQQQQQQQDSNYTFANLQDVTLLVEGTVPAMSPSPASSPSVPSINTSSTSSSDNGGSSSSSSGINKSLIAIIAGVAAAVVVAILLIGLLVVRRVVASAHSVQASDSKINDLLTLSSSGMKNEHYAQEIMVDKQDDVSTLGDPLSGYGISAGQSVKDERTVSVAEDYEYTKDLPHHPPMESDPSVADSMPFSSVASFTVTGMAAKNVGLLALASDDSSFEQHYVGGGNASNSILLLDGPGGDDKTDDDDPMAEAMDRRFLVDVPPGKLGMVIDSPHGTMPVVHAIKSDSVLASRVRVGDRLIAVDRDDVSFMTAVQVSKLISLKGDQHRRLTFIRPASMMMPSSNNNGVV